MSKHFTGPFIRLDDGVRAGDEIVALVGGSRRAGATNSFGIKEAVVSSVWMARAVVGHATVGVLETSPLNGGILGAVVDSLVLGRVGDGEDIAKRVVGAVDLVETLHGFGTPDVDDGVAGAGKEQGPIVGEEEAHDAALVGLDAVDQLEVPERPYQYLAILRAGVDAVSADDDGEDGAVMLEGVDELGRRVRSDFDDGRRCGHDRHGWHGVACRCGVMR